MFQRLDQEKKRMLKAGLLVTLSAALLLPLFPSVLTGNAKFSQVASAAGTVPYSVKDIALNPGSDESQMNFTWYSPEQPQASVVQVAKKPADGTFPADSAQSFTGTSVQAANDTVTGVTYFSNKVTVTGLEPKTNYLYRVGDGAEDHWSQAYDFATQDASNYNILFVGDPQIGAGGNVTTDTNKWDRTIERSINEFPDTSFIMSAGDQVNTASKETEFDGFEAPDELRNYAVATTVGNHDTGAVNYQWHFTVPNEAKDLGNTTAGGDYYYTYGDTLFMVLNSNSKAYDAHKTFLETTVAAVPDTKWRIVTFHHDIYGDGPHIKDTDVLAFRNAMVPTFDKLDIDLVMVGHDHTYARSTVMSQDTAQTNQLQNENGSDVNPTGITYTTANSASGSKYYDLQNTNARYIAKEIQNKKRMITNIKITPDGITLDTYEFQRTDGNSDESPEKTGASSPLTDSMTLVDTYSLVKQPENVKVYAKEENVAADATQVNYYYAINKANAVQNVDTTFHYDNTKMEYVNAELVDATLVDSTNAETYFTPVNDAVTGDVNISAHFSKPVKSAAYDEQYTDVIKFTFNLKTGISVSDLDLNKSVLVTLNKHRGLASNIEQAKATVTSGKPVTKVSVSDSNLYVPIGGSSALTAKTEPADAKNTHVVWTSSNTNIASVDTTGMVKGLAEGTVQITATTLDGTELSSTSTVTVYKKSSSGGNNPPAGSTPTPSPTPKPSASPAPSATPAPTPAPTPVPSTPASGGNNGGGTTAPQFSDIPSSFWAASAIHYLVDKQILQGTGTSSFEPNRSVTRAEFTAMLVRALGLTGTGKASFSDVKAGSWYADAVSAAVQAGIVQGQSGSAFGANAKITREEMITMLMRAYEQMHGKPTVSSAVTFADQSKISSWATTYVKQAVALDLVHGRNANQFEPKGITSRAEASVVIYNLLTK